jgi:hypothetical protein
MDPAYLFLIFMSGHEVQFERESYEKWDTVFQYMEWDGTYDGAEEWCTYGWARTSGSLSETNEFFRLTIN